MTQPEKYELCDICRKPIMGVGVLTTSIMGPRHYHPECEPSETIVRLADLARQEKERREVEERVLKL